MTVRARQSDLLLERRSELESASVALGQAASGEGRILLVEGPAGIGKTRLLAAIGEMASQAGFEVHRGGGDDLESGFAYGVLRQLLAPALARLNAAERAVVLEGPASFVASVVEGTVGDGANGLGDEGLRAAYGLYQLVQDLAESRPRLSCVDDAQWADLPSLHALGFVARRLTGLPVLLVFASRRSVEGPVKNLLGRLEPISGTRRLDLSPLGEEAVSTLARAALDRDLDASLCRRLWQMTGGNPFLVRELLVELAVDEKEWDNLASSAIECLVPHQVGRSVLRRLAAEGATAMNLAEAVAVLGEGALQEVAQLAGLGELEAVAAADRLVAVEILAPGTHLRFAHPILRQAVRAQIPPARRSLAHAQAARMLADQGQPLDRVAAQLLEALARADRWVVETLVAAAGQERLRGSPETAASLLARALAEPARPELRPRITLSLAEAQAQSGHSDAVATARHALACARGTTEEPEARLHLIRTLGLTGDFWSALDLLGGGSGEEAALDPELAVQLEAELLGIARLHIPTRHEALARLHRLAPLALPPRPASVVLLANLALAALERNEAPPKVAELAALALTEDWLIESGTFQLAYACEALMYIDRFEEAKRACDAAVEAAQRSGSLMLAVIAYGMRSNLNVRRGAVAQGAADARISYELSGELVARGLPPEGHPFGRAHLANALMAQGEWDEAGRVLADPDPAERAVENPMYLERRGRFRLARGDAAGALEDLLACGRELAGRGGVDTPAMLAWRSQAALALLNMAEKPRAQELVTEELQLATIAQVPGAIGEALVTTGLIEGGDQGIRRLRDAVDVLEASPRVLTRVRALAELGSMLRRNRKSQAARPFLVAALDLAHRHGATGLEDRAREELVIAGGRPRRAATTGLEALTATESRVAQLVVQGLTNRQIASSLFVSTRTVTTHLTHVYQKLGMVNRAELSAFLKDRLKTSVL